MNKSHMNEDTLPPKEYELTLFVMGGQAIPITAPGNMRLEDLVSEFIKAVNLPGRDGEGRPTVWRLDDKLAGRKCDLTKTVAETCGHKEIVELFLTRMVVAG